MPERAGGNEFKCLNHDLDSVQNRFERRCKEILVKTKTPL